MVNPNISNSVKRLWENPEYRERMRKAHLGQNAWNRGIPMSDEQKTKISVTLTGSVSPNKGKKADRTLRNKLSNAHKGYKWAADSKRKLRESVVNRLKELKIAPRIDRGATECFDQLNKMGYNIIHPNIHIDTMGYFVDGYDSIRHIIFEFDTPTHLAPRYADKDMIRQRNIIGYFNSIGKPLNGFIRINDTGVGEEGMTNVMNGGSYGKS